MYRATGPKLEIVIRQL